MYDSRVGRWFAPDALEKKYPNFSPYIYSFNNPIFYIDKNGDEPTPSAYKKAAEKLGVSVAQIRAIYKTEVGQNAYDKNGKIKILFERHYFHKLTGGKYDNSNPNISNSKWGGYGKSSEQHDRLNEASNLDKESAYASTSWGGFQIMGANYKSAGYNSALEFGEAMLNGNEDTHLEAFTSFVSSNQGMLKDLRDKNWSGFARKYNGPNYKANNYDQKMKNNYELYENNPLKGLEDIESSSGVNNEKPLKTYCIQYYDENGQPYGGNSGVYDDLASANKQAVLDKELLKNNTNIKSIKVEEIKK